MKKYAVFAAGMAILMASCGSTKPQDINLVGEWSIRAYNPAEVSSYNLVETDGDYRFEFDKDGNFYCGTDCNSISGSYVASGDSLSFGGLMSTLMACHKMDMEDAMTQALPKVRTIELSEDSILSMKESGGNVVVRLVKVK